MIAWPEFTFSGVNLWNFPKQNRDFMRNVAADNRAKALQLKPRKRQANGFKNFEFQPAKTEVQRYIDDRMYQCAKFGGGR